LPSNRAIPRSQRGIIKDNGVQAAASLDAANEPRRVGAGPLLEDLESPAASSRRISPQARRHNDIRRAVLERKPELRDLFGPDSRVALAVPLILAIHWATAWAVSETNLLVVFLVAFLFGQVVLHSAGALLHETAHRLVFRQRWLKLGFDLGLELILASFARQLTYQHEHITSHHPYLGEYERDYEHEDICRYMARRAFRDRHPLYQRLLTAAELFVHLLPFGFLLADEIFPRFYRRATGQPVKDVKRNIGATKPLPVEKWLFIGVSLGVNVLLFAAFGFLGWLYHIWSLSIFLGKGGVTNLGQSLSEHPDGDDENPTKSTYWWGNWILFNTGYHHEHHTFPNVACLRLPALKAGAPDAFDVAGERSYAALWWDHIRGDFSPTRQNPFLTRDNTDRCG
jgi:sphingolipid delta-4 desaturase